MARRDLGKFFRETKDPITALDDEAQRHSVHRTEPPALDAFTAGAQGQHEAEAALAAYRAPSEPPALDAWKCPDCGHSRDAHDEDGCAYLYNGDQRERCGCMPCFLCGHPHHGDWPCGEVVPASTCGCRANEAHDTRADAAPSTEGVPK